MKEDKRLREDIERNREYYQLLVDSVKDYAIFMLDPNGYVISWNTGAELIKGYKAEEIINKHFSCFYTPEDVREGIPEYALKIAKLEGKFEGEGWRVRKDGSRFWANVVITPLYDEDKHLRGFAEVIRDMTERKLMEDRINRLNLVLNSILKVNQLTIREKDRRSLIQGACNNFVKNNGYHSAWIALIDDTHTAIMTAQAKLDKDFIKLDRKMKRGELPYCAKKALKQSDIVVIKDPSTCKCPVSKRYPSGTGVMTLRLEYDGRIYGVVNVTVPVNFITDKEEHDLFKEIAEDIGFALHDIEVEEKRKKAIEELQESEERYRAIFDRSIYCVFVYDFESKFIDANKAALDLFGYGKEEISSVTFSSLLEGDDLLRATKITEEIRKNGFQKKPSVFRVKKKDGNYVWLETEGSLIYKEGKPYAVQGIGKDITRDRALKEQREKARKEAEFYADLLAHDLGNINQVTLGYLYLLENAKDEKTRKKNINNILRSITKSSQLTESIKILKIIKSTETGKFNIKKSIKRSAEKIKDYFDRDIEINIDAEGEFYVIANEFLDRVFFNVLENSVEHTFYDPVIIDIRIEEKNGFCNVHIRDYGLGISSEKRKDILRNLETLSKRTGMGLYLAKKILERFGGNFDIKTMEKGVEIIVSLPTIDKNSGTHAQFMEDNS